MIYEASVPGFFRTIAIILIIYYGFKLLSRYVFPFLLKRWLNKKMGQFQNQTGQQFNDAEQAKQFAKEHEGEVKVEKVNRNSAETKKSSGIDDGDYVEFEELD